MINNKIILQRINAHVLMCYFALSLSGQMPINQDSISSHLPQIQPLSTGKPMPLSAVQKKQIEINDRLYVLEELAQLDKSSYAILSIDAQYDSIFVNNAIDTCLKYLGNSFSYFRLSNLECLPLNISKIRSVGRWMFEEVQQLDLSKLRPTYQSIGFEKCGLDTLSLKFLPESLQVLNLNADYHEIPEVLSTRFIALGLFSSPKSRIIRDWFSSRQRGLVHFEENSIEIVEVPLLGKTGGLDIYRSGLPYKRSQPQATKAMRKYDRQTLRAKKIINTRSVEQLVLETKWQRKPKWQRKIRGFVKMLFM